MSNSFFHGPNAAKLVARGMVLLALAQLAWLECWPDSALDSIRTRLKNPAAALAEYKESDDLASRYGEGNIFICFTGLPKENPDAEAVQSFADFRDVYLSAFYFRTVYNVYPRRAFVAPPDKIINGGWNLMGIAFVPAPAWLAAHDVRSVLTLGFDNAGHRLAPRLEPVASTEFKKGGD